QESSRDDLIGVDVLRRKTDGAGCDAFEFGHMFNIPRKSVTRPVTADAAAVCGDASKVRPPGPCRPSKLRLLVLMEYCPGSSLSAFMAMHMLHPDSRHSAPASLKTRSSPSSSASFLICCDPGTTTVRTVEATLRPRKISAAARRSDMREFVQL